MYHFSYDHTFPIYAVVIFDFRYTKYFKKGHKLFLNQFPDTLSPNYPGMMEEYPNQIPSYGEYMLSTTSLKLKRFINTYVDEYLKRW